MQTRNKFLDDMSQLMTNAMGVAQGAKLSLIHISEPTRPY